MKSDPASRQSCKGDADCPSGNLCYPGQQVCVDVYEGIPMVDVSTGVKEDMHGCRLVNVYFPFDSSELVAEAMKWLNYNIRCLVAHQAKRVTLEAHCDSRGDQEYNLALSRRRAEAVRAYLQDHGLKIDINLSGLGKTEPLKEGVTEQDYAWNRRVEFRYE